MLARQSLFFEDQEAYTRWIQTIPPIMRVLDGENEHDELAEDVELPDFYDERHLILHVQRRYCVLVRVATREHADYTWYVRGAEQDTGEEVYAAYLWDKQVIVGGMTIQQTKAALYLFLKQHGNWPATVHLLPNR